MPSATWPSASRAGRWRPIAGCCPRRRIRAMRPLISLLACLALLAPAAAAMEMDSGSPEHVADALAALRAHKNAAAKMHLKEAIATKAEPKAARDHAKEALAALKRANRAEAIEHATNGPAVEHLTYALAALQEKKIAVAKEHLAEARELEPYASAA